MNRKWLVDYLTARHHLDRKTAMEVAVTVEGAAADLEEVVAALAPGTDARKVTAECLRYVHA